MTDMCTCPAYREAERHVKPRARLAECSTVVPLPPPCLWRKVENNLLCLDILEAALEHTIYLGVVTNIAIRG